jgi:phage baseplate assembly protein W
MNSIVAAAFAAELATLERVVTPPADPLGYGTDLSCVLDCTNDFAEVSGPLVVVQSVARSFITPRGSVLDSPDFGTDVRALLNHGTPQHDLRMMQSRLRSEAMADERVENAEVKLTLSALGSEVTIDTRLTLRDPQRTTFQFVLAVTDSAALITLMQGDT